MSYLNDATRVSQKADLAAFYKTNAALLAAQPGLLGAATAGKALVPSTAAFAAAAPHPSEAQSDLASARAGAEVAVQTALRDPSVPPRWAQAARAAARSATPP